METLDKKSLSERDICTKFITPAIVDIAGWDRDVQIHEEVYLTKGRIIVRGKLHTRGEQKRADYVPRWLGLTFDARDKEALFFQALKVFNPAAAVGGRIPAEDFRQGKWDDLMNQFARSIEQATANLPMLRRLKEEYEDAVFSPDEVSVLCEECLKVRVTTDDPQALSALETLIRACDEAMKERSGLFFASN